MADVEILVDSKPLFEAGVWGSIGQAIYVMEDEEEVKAKHPHSVQADSASKVTFLTTVRPAMREQEGDCND